MKSRGIGHDELAVAGTAAVLGLWLLQPSLIWALAAFGLGAAGALFATRAKRSALLVAAVLGLVGATSAGVTSGRVLTVERSWDRLREQLIINVGRQLGVTLESTVSLARTLADRGAAFATRAQPAAFDELKRVVPQGGPESGVVILDSALHPWAWAGRHRLPPARSPRELYARITPFYVVLEARRQTGDRVAIGHVVLMADSSVPDREGTVAARFTSATGAALEFYAPGRAPVRTDVFDYCLPTCTPGPGNLAPDTLFTVRTAPPSQGALKLSLLAGGGRTAAAAALLCLIALMVAGSVRSRYLALAFAAAILIFTPAGTRLGLGSFFSPATYYLGAFDPLTASAGALWLTGVLALVASVVLRHRTLPARISLAVGVILLAATPPLAGILSTGIVPPPAGVGVGLWVGWEIPIAVFIAAMVFVVGSLLPPPAIPRRWIPWAAAGLAVVCAMLGLLVWRPERGWHTWYLWLWVPSILLASRTGGRVRRVITGAVVAGSAAAVLTWGAVVDGRLGLARADAQHLGGERDPLAIALLERIGNDPDLNSPPRTAAELYSLWYRSSLAVAGYPAVFAVWGPQGQPVADLPLARLELPPRLLQAVATSAATRHQSNVEVFDRIPGPHAVLARPFADGSVLTVGVGPKTRLIPAFRIARLMIPETRVPTPAPYEMTLSEVAGEPGLTPTLVWRREGQTVHGDAKLDFPGALGSRHLHVTVDLGELPALVVRGALLLFADVAVTLLFWLAGEALLGRTEFLQRVRGAIRMRSYRLQIAGALAIFFIVPTVGFSAWMAGRLRADTVHSQDLVIRQSLRDAMTSVPDDPDSTPLEPLDAVADRVGAELLVYREGLLELASAPAVKEMGLIDAYLPPAVYGNLLEDEGSETMDDIAIAGRPARTGFQAQGTARGIVMAMPHLPDERPLMGDSDLAYALLLVTLIGLAAAATLARAAARTLAQPVGALRTAAETVGRGETPAPFGSEVPEEFVPVAEAFTRMAADVRASQAALEAARRRTVAVLRNVATGVVAVDRDLHISLANPRAEELLGQKLDPDSPLGSGAANTAWTPVWQWVRSFVESGADLSGEEFTINGRRIRVQASSLGTESGCVVALDDVTELTHAVRVLAWGEIARQVAHEIKNPLTPMRLGIQHLRRVRAEKRGDFEQTLEKTSTQILAEIDRLDSVARAFARFGAPPAEQEVGPLSVIDLVAVARETAALYALGGDSGVKLQTDGVVRAMARPDELKEVLVNLVENAKNARATDIAVSIREAGASRAQIVVADNGGGIRPEDLPRIFEPHFSTTTSGTGLGLAICRRLVASWGGTIAVQSTLGSGTTVTIELAAG